MLFFKVTKQLCWAAPEERELDSFSHSCIGTFTASEMTKRRHAEKQIIHFLLCKWLGEDVGCSGTFKDLSFHSTLVPNSQESYSLFCPSFYTCHWNFVIAFQSTYSWRVMCLLVPCICCLSSSPEGKLQEGGTFVFHHWFVNFSFFYPQYLEQFPASSRCSMHLYRMNKWTDLDPCFVPVSLTNIMVTYSVSPSWHKSKYALMWSLGLEMSCMDMEQFLSVL